MPQICLLLRAVCCNVLLQCGAVSRSVEQCSDYGAVWCRVVQFVMSLQCQSLLFRNTRVSKVCIQSGPILDASPIYAIYSWSNPSLQYSWCNSSLLFTPLLVQLFSPFYATPDAMPLSSILFPEYWCNSSLVSTLLFPNYNTPDTTLLSSPQYSWIISSLLATIYLMHTFILDVNPHLLLLPTLLSLPICSLTHCT